MYGHKKILLIAAILTAGATWWLAFATSFWSFLVAWALQGFYVVWLPLEIALIFERGRRQAAGCRRRDARRVCSSSGSRRAPSSAPSPRAHLRRDGRESHDDARGAGDRGDPRRARHLDRRPRIAPEPGRRSTRGAS
jgi:hypothetical protein